MANCESCMHVAVCSKYQATGGHVRDCRHYAEQKRGQWVGEGDGYADGELVFDVWYCDNCNYCIDDGTDDPEMLPNYCPNCGADMQTERTEDG